MRKTTKTFFDKSLVEQFQNVSPDLKFIFVCDSVMAQNPEPYY